MRDEFLIEQRGKKYVLYAGLLDEAHQRGLSMIETTLVQLPTEHNGDTAIVHAVVRTEDGKFTGLGDANPQNVNKNIAPHAIRMAETRAKARALRDAINVGVTAFEELGGDDAEPGDAREPAALNPELRKRLRANGKPARKGQIDLLKTLAVEWRGELGVERLEARIGKSLHNLTGAEADEWIDKLTPEAR